MDLQGLFIANSQKPIYHLKTIHIANKNMYIYIYIYFFFFQYHSCTWWLKGIFILTKSYPLATGLIIFFN